MYLVCLHDHPTTFSHNNHPLFRVQVNPVYLRKTPESPSPAAFDPCFWDLCPSILILVTLEPGFKQQPSATQPPALYHFLIQKPPVLYHFCYNGKSPEPPLLRGYMVIFVFLLLLSIIQVPRGGIQPTPFFTAVPVSRSIFRAFFSRPGRSIW